MTNTIRAERATIEFCDGLSVDGYRMSDGEFRVGLASASEAAGYGKEWLGRTLSRDGNRNKALQSTGFSGQIQKLATETIRGSRESQTISIEDFVCLLRFGDRQGKASAGAILSASAKISVTDIFRDGFDQTPLTIEEKREMFYQSVSETINWLEEDKNDRNDLIGWG